MSLQPLHESKMRFCGVQKLLGGAYGFLSSFLSTWCGFPERSGAGWETSHRSPTTPVTPWQSCSDIWDEDVLSIHPLCSLMVGGDLTVLCSHRRAWLISSLVPCSSLLLLFGSPKSCVWSFTTPSKCLHGSAPFKHTHIVSLLLSGVETAFQRCFGTQIAQGWLDTRWKELSALLTCSIETLWQYSSQTHWKENVKTTRRTQ